MDTKAKTPGKWTSLVGGVHHFANAMAIVASMAAMALAANVLFDVSSRFLFNRPLQGTFELVAYWWMPTLTVLALAAAEDRREHIRATIVLDLLPPEWRRHSEVFIATFSALIVGYLAYQTALNSLARVEARQAVSGAIELPTWPIHLLVAAALFVALVQAVVTVYRYGRGDLRPSLDPSSRL